jgi:oxygen-dependent protoporphyrinogen oxidase
VPKYNGNKEETIAEFTTRRLGKEAADTLIATLVGGIFAGDTNKLSMAAAFPNIYALEAQSGGLIHGAIDKARAAKAARKAAGEPKKKRDKDGYKLMSSATGMQGLVQELANKCKAEFLYNTTVKNVEKTENKYKIDGREFDKVVFCCNSHDIAEITKSLDSDLSAEMAKVEFSPVFICGMGFKKDDIGQPLDGFGYLVTPSEKSIVLGTLFSSSLFAGRAPEGYSLITVITIGDRNRDAFAKSDEELKAEAFSDIKDVLKINTQPECTIAFRHNRAMPQYYIGHLNIKSNVDKILRNHKGIYIGGNTFGGVSIADCIATSSALAEQIVK